MAEISVTRKVDQIVILEGAARGLREQVAALQGQIAALKARDAAYYTARAQEIREDDRAEVVSLQQELDGLKVFWAELTGKAFPQR